MEMNKKFLWAIPVLLLISITIFVLKNKPELKFYLEDKYYEKSGFVDIDNTKLNELIDSKESFALFVYQPACVTSSDFEQVLYDFSQSNNIEIYKIAFSDIKSTSLSKYIKYYPSFAIFNKGSIVSYLDAESDDDLKYYKSKDEFEKWFTNYVLLKEVEILNQDNNENNNEEIKEDSNENTQESITEKNTNEINLDQVTYDKNKVNIYFFWGSTCPHCKEEFAFFDEIKEEYGDYYNLYTYEVWENPDNEKIMNQFANALNEEITGVPYTVIGDESFTGFSESSKEKFIEAIKDKHQNSKDVYFNKIKSED